MAVNAMSLKIHLLLVLLNQRLLCFLEQLVVQGHLGKRILRGHQNARSWPLGGSSSAQVELTRHVEIRDTAVLAHNRKVDNNINGTDVAGNNAESLASLSERFHNLLHTSSDKLSLRCLLNQLVQLLSGLLRRQGLSNFTNELNLQKKRG